MAQEQCSCHSSSSHSSVQQTLDEIDFSRGIWQRILDRDYQSVRTHVRKHPEDVNKPDGSGYTPLHYAVMREDNFEIVKFLLGNGADVSAPTRAGGATPLHRAALKDNVEVVKLLVREGASLTRRNADGLTPLDVAIRQNSLRTTEFLTSL